LEWPQTIQSPGPMKRVTPQEPSRARRLEPMRSPARAGRVVAEAPEVVNFGTTFVSGTGASYAGGVTAAARTSRAAIRSPGPLAVGAVSPGGIGPDRSRAPVLAGGANWDCPFPEEADDAGIDRAVVPLRVEVTSDGRVSRASAASDEGHGFARAAE